MEETSTVTRLSVRGRLKRTLAGLDNPCGSVIDSVRRAARNVKRRHDDRLDERHLDRLVASGVDELSCRRGQRYLVTVIEVVADEVRQAFAGEIDIAAVPAAHLILRTGWPL